MGEALKTIWEKSPFPCSKCLQPFIPELVKVLERHGELKIEDALREQVPWVSPAMIDRRLRPHRAKDLRLRQPYLAVGYTTELSVGSTAGELAYGSRLPFRPSWRAFPTSARAV